MGVEVSALCGSACGFQPVPRGAYQPLITQQ